MWYSRSRWCGTACGNDHSDELELADLLSIPDDTYMHVSTAFESIIQKRCSNPRGKTSRISSSFHLSKPPTMLIVKIFLSRNEPSQLGSTELIVSTDCFVPELKVCRDSDSEYCEGAKFHGLEVGGLEWLLLRVSIAIKSWNPAAEQATKKSLYHWLQNDQHRRRNLEQCSQVKRRN